MLINPRTWSLAFPILGCFLNQILTTTSYSAEFWTVPSAYEQISYDLPLDREGMVLSAIEVLAPLRDKVNAATNSGARSARGSKSEQQKLGNIMGTTHAFMPGIKCQSSHSVREQHSGHTIDKWQYALHWRRNNRLRIATLHPYQMIFSTSSFMVSR